MTEMIDFEELKREVDRKMRQQKFEDAWDWVTENWQYLAVIVPGIFGIGKKLLGDHKKTSEESLKERRFYDPRKGRYSTARRKLTKKEERLVEDRYNRGESYRAILDDLGLLK